MKRNTYFAIVLGLLMRAAAAWAQEATIPPPPLPPLPADGQFFYVRTEGLFSGGLESVKGAPFSARAVTETTQALADGNQINRTETSQLYRDNAGRVRRESTLTLIGPWAAKTPRQVVNIIDPVAGVNYTLDVNDKTAVKLPFHARPGHMKGDRVMMMMGAGGGNVAFQKSDEGPDAPVTAGAAVASDAQPDAENSIQRATESLGTRKMAGVTAQGTRTTETIPAGLIGNENEIVTISERWYSPDLHTTVYSKRNDPRFGTTVYQLTDISRTEPDASLFQVPADYTIKDKPGMMLHPKPAE